MTAPNQVSVPDSIQAAVPDSPDFLHATRASYDAMAADYTERYADPLADLPLDRALVGAFAELVRSQGPAPVADIGSGPGGVTARVHALGVPVFGVDLSPRMVALARRAHPELRFHVGSMTSLDLPDETLGGVLALYSIIHVPDAALPTVFAEFHRVLAPGGHVLLGFQSAAADDDHLHLTERFGHEMSLDYWFRTSAKVAGLLAAAGLTVRARTVREPDEDEKRQRTYLLARKPL
ncbi:class I SAM-dependent DNA methyltransferase [Streptomyces graminilatus]|uniref:class I SAM-dependent DNA methyltransferase n=1 Tax=Streptomyces graminilatus TaxID=1464070 RepID=UPI00099E8769|nr:class I SAM-dependent methyltransferase [Streptomyces graminilatus]